MFGKFNFANNVQTTLASAITATQTSNIRLVNNGKLPPHSTSGKVTVFTLMDRLHNPSLIEIIHCNVFNTFSSPAASDVSRGMEGTVRRAWPSGTIVIQAITAGMLNHPVSEVQAIFATSVVAGSVNAQNLSTFSGGIGTGPGSDTIINGRLIVPRDGAPTSTTSPGVPGQIVVANGFLYVCTGTNQWRRVTLSTF